ncbi:MAG: hypothetical protein WKF78_13525 [Candidatus Limnocylindrales bacterium]
MSGVVLIGALLIVNMSLTIRDQLPYLVLFSLAALFLLIRSHTFDEQSDWVRRRVGDPSAMSGMYLRGGTIFIGLAVLGSLLLTNVAASDPLAGVWTDASVRFVEWSRAIDRFLPKGGQGVAFSPSFGSSATISGSWFTNNDLALTVEVPVGEKDVPYWRAVTYDQLVLDGYTRGPDTSTISRGTDAPLLDETGDAVDPKGRREVSFTITPATGGDTLFAPQTPLTVSVPTQRDAGRRERVFRDPRPRGLQHAVHRHLPHPGRGRHRRRRPDPESTARGRPGLPRRGRGALRGSTDGGDHRPRSPAHPGRDQGGRRQQPL